MKNKNLCVKVLVLILCFAISLSCLFSCVSKEQIEDVNSKLDILEDGKVDKETYDALDAFVKEIDVIAKAAVSTEKFEAALDTLNASIATKADAAKVSEDITAAKNALKEMLDENAAGDVTTKESLEAALVKITALEGSVATKVALNEAVTDINATITANKKAVEDKIAEIENLVAKNADKATVDAALADLAKTVADNKTTVDKAINDAKSELEGKLDAANKELDNLAETVTANKTAAEKAINDAKTTIETKIAEANTAIGELESVVNNNNTKMTAEVADLKDAIKLLQAADEANAKDLADLRAAYEAQVNELKKTDTDNAKAVNDKITALETKVEGLTAELTSAIAAINTTIDNKIDGLKDELNTKIDKLQADYDAFVEKTGSDITGINNIIITLQGEISALKENNNSFADEYKKATEELYNGEYSIDNFNAKVAEIVAEDYEETKYKEFEDAVERLRFFLNRAITVEAIKGYFAELDSIIEGMPTLVESLTEMLTAYTESAPEGERKYLTVNPDELKSINIVYEKIDEVDAKLEALYQAITAAHANLVEANKAAEDVKVNINNITTPIVYTTSEPAIVYAENAFEAYSSDYFADAEMIKYYGETTAASLVTNYEKLAGYRAYYDNLVNAADGKVNFKDVVLNYNTVRPLWKDLVDIEADVALYEEWIVTYNINVTVDAASIATIYGGELELLANAQAYAAYMNGVYVDNGVEALVNEISTYVSATNVLYATKDKCDKLNELRETVKTAIEAVDDFAADDRNYVEMFGQENIDKLAEAAARIDELVEAKVAIDEVYAEMDAMLNKDGGITYDDSDVISQFKPRLDALYAQYAISSEKDADENYVDQNYVDLAADAEAKYAELIVAYEAVIGEVVDLINEINKKLDAMKWLLKDGKEIQGIVDDLSRFIFEFEVTTVDLWLPSEGENLEVDLSDLLKKYTAAASAYKTQAKAAEAAAAEVNAAIEALVNVNAKDIKNNATVKDTYDKFVAWCETYLADDIAAAEGDIATAIAEIQGVAVYGAKDTYYVFVSVTNYTNVVTAYNDANTAMTNAETSWNAIKTDMANLIAGWDIHSYEDNDVNFVAVKAAYDEYVATYYDGSIDVDNDVFGELDESNEVNVIAFETEMTDCKTRLDEAQGVADAINAKIDALPEVTTLNATDVLTLVAEIRGDIANYEDVYCTDSCMFVTEEFDNIFKLYQIEKFAEYAKAVNEAYAYADEQSEADTLDEAFLMAKQNIMETATDAKKVDLAYAFAMNALNDYVRELQTPATP